jgi:tripartite-type tricarboxylate transporter receptor subunit TctC
MKNLFYFLLIICSTVNAKETVTIFFPFLFSQPFNYKLVDEANKAQDKWNFIIIPKAGAGGELAATGALDTSKYYMLSGTSSFFIRPNLSNNSSYKVDQFKLLSAQCSAPIIAVSSKYKSLKDINQPVTVGITGLGSTTHLVALQIAKKIPNVTIVPYNGGNETQKAVLSKEIDIAIGFINQWEHYIEAKTIYPLGITGNINLLNVPTFKSQKFPDIGGENTFFLAVNKNILPKLYDEWKKLFTDAAKSIRVRQSYKEEFCTPIEDETESWLAEQERFWKNITKDITPE